LKQDYPKEKIEIIISDGGSSDATIDIARSREVTKITTNPLVSGEAGKAIGVDNAMNDIVALIDSDNLLEDNAWLLKMVQPFKDHEIVSSEPLYWTYRSKDSHVNRYCALTGVNDPTCLFIGNYDRFSYLTGKWTDLPLKENDKGGYLKVTLYRGKVPTMGANGFLVRRSVLRKINYQPYLFDVDIVCQMIEVGYDTIARPKVGIIHLFSDDVKGFTKKTLRRVRDFVMFSSGKR
jgi:glycosyltransferase involved in cell wall biosynthesis